MNVLLVLAIILAVIVAAGFFEYRYHIKNLSSIPVRIHVNGTRGKSSVTRLIAAGLKEGGIRVFAKTTGTLARVITHKGSEFPIFRPFNANIIEQLRVFSFASRNRAEALVIECMALQPSLQSLTELKIVKATHGVITNARADHLDVMGPEERDVALALLGTTPMNSKLFTAERDYPEEFSLACRDRSSELIVVDDSDLLAVSDEDMSGFSYIEHRENVALALKVCCSVGIHRDVALRGMHKVKPDVGAMSEYCVDFFGRKIFFINGFAANDPESSERVWEMGLQRHEKRRRIMVINTRGDRPDRSRQLGEALCEWSVADRYVVIGSGCDVLIRSAVRHGMDASVFINAELSSAEKVFEVIVDVSGVEAMVMGLGNIKGIGLDLIKYFKNRSTLER